MGRATVVIGANYGDEGKGLMVDYLASKASGEKIVVRFNGGAQAGHTAISPDGRRHVFSHFGAGTLAGAGTYLAKHFVCNPILFWQEQKILKMEPAIAADPRCFITTPYDMMINQAVEDARGDKRHGSCGVGFGETIERNNYPAFRLWKSDLNDKKKISEKLRLIRDRWLPVRCRQLGVPEFQRNDARLTDILLNRTIEAAVAFDASVVTAGAEFVEKKSVIFEGAQGLCLDMGSKNFPHVTRSNTGLKNVIPLARALRLSLDVIYMTRPYLTKHGAGPLPGEYVPETLIVDETNIGHPYQGTLRFGRLDTTALKQRIIDDMKLDPSASATVGLSCVDHADPKEVDALISTLGMISHRSVGPRRDHVEQVTPLRMKRTPWAA